MKVRALAAAALALALPLTAAACGGKDDTNSGSRPTVAELKAQILKESGLDGSNPIYSEYGDCAAEGIHKSDVPNGVLRKLVKGEEAKVDSDNKDDYEKTLTDIQSDCQDKALEKAKSGAGGATTTTAG